MSSATVNGPSDDPQQCYYTVAGPRLRVAGPSPASPTNFLKRLKEKIILITGASRGIGRAMALRFARDGARIVIAGKTVQPHPKLSGTIHTVAKEIEEAGGKALPIPIDVRFEDQVEAMIQKTVEVFGGIDILINNAGAIHLTSTAETPMKRFDLMQSINTRAVFLCSQKAIPFLQKSENPHILNLSPPLNWNPKWLKNHLAYTLSKYGMTMLTLGLAEEFREVGIAVNSLWPKTIIATAAIEMLFGEAGKKQCRSPEIMADAAYEIITSPSPNLTGQTLIDEDFLKSRGVRDFEKYAVARGNPLTTDLFID